MKQETKQTAVEWLIEEIRQRMITIHREPNGATREVMILNLDMDLEKFKELEKQQKRKDFTDGYMHGNEPLNHDVIDKWYNKTYGGDK